MGGGSIPRCLEEGGRFGSGLNQKIQDPIPMIHIIDW
jgi:hypothetical protein